MSVLIPEFTATLEKVTVVAKETKVFRFHVHSSDTHHFTFRTGQFISLKIQEKVFRAYSISSSPKELPIFETCVKILPGGVGSTYLDTMKEGDEITFRGAFGQFTIQNPERNKIFIATGTGISPIKAFVEEFAEGKLTGKHTLVFGVRTADYGAYMQEFLELQETNSDFDFTLCVSQPEDNDFVGMKGRVTDWVQRKDAEYFQEKDVYICGSPPMVKEVTHVLTQEKSFPKESIFTEAY